MILAIFVSTGRLETFSALGYPKNAFALGAISSPDVADLWELSSSNLGPYDNNNQMLGFSGHIAYVSSIATPSPALEQRKLAPIFFVKH